MFTFRCPNLFTFKRPLTSDVVIAKNYLDKDELAHLNRLVDMYLDYAENQAKKKIPMTMADWAARLDAFLQFNEEELLTDENGKVSRANPHHCSLKIPGCYL